MDSSKVIKIGDLFLHDEDIVSVTTSKMENDNGSISQYLIIKHNGITEDILDEDGEIYAKVCKYFKFENISSFRTIL